MKKWLSILPLSLILLLCACQSSDASAQIFAMDTVMDLTVQGSGSAQALKDAEAELYRLDALLSRQDSASAVSALNESAGSPVAVEEELYNLLQTAVEYSTLTDGAFAVTVAPIMDAWDFTGLLLWAFPPKECSPFPWVQTSWSAMGKSMDFAK